MILANAAATLSIVAAISPPVDSPATGANNLAKKLSIDLSASGTAFRETFLFSAAAQAITYNRLTGAITGLTGVRQVETATVVAAAGCTANGNLALTLTGALITGSPLAVTVPLTTTAHTTASLIAAAIAAKLNTLAAVTAYYSVTASGATVILTCLRGRANDATLNLAIAAGLGVSVAASSANTTAGVAGPVVLRAGGAAGTDFYGRPLATATHTRMMSVSNLGAASTIPVTTTAGGAGIMPGLYPGATGIYLAPTTTATTLPNSMDFAASGEADLEIFTISEIAA